MRLHKIPGFPNSVRQALEENLNLYTAERFIDFATDDPEEVSEAASVSRKEVRRLVVLARAGLMTTCESQ